MPELRYRPMWILTSAALVGAVVWASLQTSLKLSPASGMDKVQHLATYMMLTMWFTGLLPRNRYWLVGAGLLGFGIALELAQFLMHAGRTADPLDMLANACGVFAGLVVARIGTGGWARRFEAWIA